MKEGGITMTDWQYTQTEGLQPLSLEQLPPRHDHEKGEEYINRLGYCQAAWLDDLHDRPPYWKLNATYPISLLQGCEGEARTLPWRYLLPLWMPGGQIEAIWIPTFPDWLSFAATYGPGLFVHGLTRQIVRLARKVERLTDTED